LVDRLFVVVSGSLQLTYHPPGAAAQAPLRPGGERDLLDTQSRGVPLRVLVAGDDLGAEAALLLDEQEVLMGTAEDTLSEDEQARRMWPGDLHARCATELLVLSVEGLRSLLQSDDALRISILSHSRAVRRVVRMRYIARP
jgi:hypothetical protein